MNTTKLIWTLLSAALVVALTTGIACRPAAEEASKPTTEQVAAKGAEIKPAETKPAETKPAETKPAETKPAETKPAETKPAETKPAETKPAEIKPAEIKPAEIKPAEIKPAETKPAETKPAETKPAAGAALQTPPGLPALSVPAANPMTPEKVELGRMLYFDKRVSRDGTIACATCHDPKMAWAEHSSTSDGIDKQRGGRNSPTVINAAYATSQFWDGRAGSLEEQALGPVENPIEMGHSMDALVANFKKIPEYRERFQKVFGEEITKENFGKAIAAFERTVLSGNSPYDRVTAGDEKALSDAQKRGLQKFKDACAGCHAPPLFSNYEFANAGVGMDKPNPDPGRKKVTGRDRDLGKFRVPALREVANTYPYFHDGSAATLEEAVALMAAGGKDNANLSPMLKAVREEKLTAADQKDIVEFLRGLSGQYPVIEAPKLPADAK